jgi:hypothetical protein
MITRRNPLTCRLTQAALVSLTTIAALVVSASPASAVTPAPAWQIRTLTSPTNISPANGAKLTVLARDVGGQPTDGSTVTVTDTLPAGVTPTEATGSEPTFTGDTMECVIAGQTVTCTYAHALPPLNETQLVLNIQVSVTPGTLGALPNAATVSGGGAAEVTANEPITVSTQDPPFGLADFSTYDANPSGAQDTQAGGHPNALVTTFDINSIVSPDPGEFGKVAGVQDLKDVVVDLPLGLIGNPQATPKCPQYDLTGQHGFRCPADTFIGTVALNSPIQAFGSSSLEGEPSPIVNVQPEAGYPAQFAFTEGSNAIMLYAKVVSTSSGYVVRVASPGITRFIKAKGATLTFFGDPRAQSPFGNQPGAPAAFFTNPVDCSAPQFTTTIHVDSWQNPAPVPLNPDGSANFTAVNFNDPQWKNATAVSPPVTGCEKLQFNPTISLQPDTTQADSPTGLNVDLNVAQNNDPTGLATPPLKDATVTLPQGMAVSPSSADGLQGCSDAQIALSSTESATCPDASVIGTVKVHTPLLADPLEGRVFLGTPLCGPCMNADAQSGRMLRLFVEVADSARGVDIKLPGTVSADPSTGQLTAMFKNNPQLPFDDLKLDFKGGVRAPLATPSVCGSYTSTSVLRPWSSPFTPDARPSSSFEVTGCGNPNQFAPSFSAGTVNPQAGAFSPFTLSFSRQDTDQQFSSLSATLPPGLLARLAGVPLCPDANATAGTCPAASEIGSVTTGAGPGSHPFFLPGQVYLTGPYNGGPYGLSVEVPAVAGPFNLGTVVVRNSIRINPATGQATVVSDQFPNMLAGIPLQIRTVNVTLDRPEFTFNPTNCNTMAVTGKLVSTQGTSAPVSSRFQSANCASLAFKPSFTVATAGHSSKAGGASLDVKVTSKGGPQSGGGEANIRSVKVALPIQLPSRLTTLQKACLAAVFEANPASCPKESDVGTATAKTPVLANPLSGPAYLVSHGGAAFPDLEIVLQGEGVVLILDGQTNIKKGITSSNFATVPDAPISSFELKLPTGKFSVLSPNLPEKAKFSFCGQKLTLPTRITAQNGAVLTQSTPVEVQGCPNGLRILSHSIRKRTLTIKVIVPGAGKLTASGKGLSTSSKSSKGRSTLTLTIKAKKGGRLKTKVKLSFAPTKGHKLAATVAARFKR